jgi:AcrR family transcriptional regulator
MKPRQQKKRAAKAQTRLRRPQTMKPRAVGLSRDRIVVESLRYLRAHPTERLTLAKAAATLGATSMALYRHFKNGDDLARAIVDAVISGVEHEIPTDQDWRTQVRAWMTAIYRRLVGTPQCVDMLKPQETGISPGWLRAAAILRRGLEAGGLRDRRLAEAMFWVSLSVTAFARQTCGIYLPAQVKATQEAIAALKPEEAAGFKAFLDHIPRLYNQAQEIMLDRVLASIDCLREEARAAPESRPS